MGGRKTVADIDFVLHIHGAGALGKEACRAIFPDDQLVAARHGSAGHRHGAGRLAGHIGDLGRDTGAAVRGSAGRGGEDRSHVVIGRAEIGPNCIARRRDDVGHATNQGGGVDRGGFVLADKDVVGRRQRASAQIVGTDAALVAVACSHAELAVHVERAGRLVECSHAVAAADIHVAIALGRDRAAVDVQNARAEFAPHDELVGNAERSGPVQRVASRTGIVIADVHFAVRADGAAALQYAANAIVLPDEKLSPAGLDHRATGHGHRAGAPVVSDVSRVVQRHVARFEVEGTLTARGVPDKQLAGNRQGSVGVYVDCGRAIVTESRNEEIPRGVERTGSLGIAGNARAWGARVGQIINAVVNFHPSAAEGASHTS